MNKECLALVSHEGRIFTTHECDEGDSVAWDAFAIEHGASYCHRFLWKGVFERAYGLKTYYLAFSSDEVWVGILPIVVMPSLFGISRRAVSLPYCNYGGLVSKSDALDTALKSIALKFMSRLGVDIIEFREQGVTGQLCTEDVSMVLPLPSQVDQLWDQIGSKIRNQVRKAMRLGLQIRWGIDQVRDLHEIYSANMGRLGTPAHSICFLEEVLAGFCDDADILTVRLDQRPIGAMLVLKNGTLWADPLASCLAEFNHLNPNMMMYWEALRMACEANAAAFDFGRSSKTSGTYRFKKQWGCREVSLNYCAYVYGNLSSKASTSFYRTVGAKHMASIWRRLPLVLQRQVGGSVRRWLP